MCVDYLHRWCSTIDCCRAMSTIRLTVHRLGWPTCASTLGVIAASTCSAQWTAIRVTSTASRAAGRSIRVVRGSSPISRSRAITPDATGAIYRPVVCSRTSVRSIWPITRPYNHSLLVRCQWLPLYPLPIYQWT